MVPLKFPHYALHRKLKPTDVGLAAVLLEERGSPYFRNKEGDKMRINLKRMMVLVAAVALCGTGSVFASPDVSSSVEPEKAQSAAYLSGRASILLNDIQDEAAALQLHAETLGTFAWNPQYSWQSHAFYLERVKGHINTVGERIVELQQIRHAALPWQQQAIDEVAAHAAQVATNTQAAIAHLGESQNRQFAPEYRDHLTTIASGSENMKETIDKFLNYERAQKDYQEAQRKFQQLQDELELTGD
jgi:signal transduction histidine kinase